jgi:4-aminobutyrate aminotransferase-like enzyme
MIGPATYFRPEHRAGLDDHTRALIDRREAALSPGYRLFYSHPVEFVRGSGTKLYTRDGDEYLDVYNNVPSVGHSHPRVTAAVAEQAALLNTHTRYLHEGLIDYAELLLASFDARLDALTLVCTGSEANDLALRVAKHATEARGVIVTENAYHGVTTEIAAISPSLGGPASLADWVRTVQDQKKAQAAARRSARAAGAGERHGQRDVRPFARGTADGRTHRQRAGG